MSDFSDDDMSNFYDSISSPLSYIFNIDKTMGIHLGYYEKGIRTYENSIINMNHYVGKLLDLDKLNDKKDGRILDAGCGVGGTLIYFAKTYKNINYMGINISPSQIHLANKFALENGAESKIDFLLGNFIETKMLNNYFDGICVIESVCHAYDKKKFLREMYRILKSEGKLVVIDGFLRKQPTSYFCKIAYDYFCKEYMIPFFEKIEIFKSDLSETGFTDIKVRYITKNIFVSFIIQNLRTLSYIWIKDQKEDKKITKKNYRKSFVKLIKDIFTPIVVGLNLRYVTFVAIKK